jgi:hypothetical protein
MPKHPVQPPEWIDAAPIRVVEQIEIDAPPAVVWSHIVDHMSWPTWFTAVNRVEILGEPAGVGGGRRVFARRLAVDEEFTAWDENAHFAFAVVASNLPILHTLAESVRLEPSGTGTSAATRVVYRQGLRGRAGAGWLMRLLWRPAAKGLGPSLANLKTLIEAERRGAADRG